MSKTVNNQTTSASSLLLLIAALALLGHCREASDLCLEVAWPALVGKWEAEDPSVKLQLSRKPLELMLYPAGEAIMNGRRGSWKVVACEGPIVVIDLPRRAQTDACELRIQGLIETEPSEFFINVDRTAGSLNCANESIKVRRTETRGWLPAALAETATEEREARRRYEEDLKNRTGWSRLWRQILYKFTHG